MGGELANPPKSLHPYRLFVLGGIGYVDNSNAPAYPVAMSYWDHFGIDWVCGRLESGMMYKHIADEVGGSDTDLCRWIAADQGRSARVAESRAKGAFAWDTMAQDVLAAIPSDATQGDITRARELASHFRWRASKLGRKIYGERVQVDGKTTVTINHVTNVDDQDPEDICGV